MTSRERVLTALNHKEPDRIPWDFGATKVCKCHVIFYRKLLKELGIDEEPVIAAKMGQHALISEAVQRRLECDMRTPYPPFLKDKSAVAKEWEDDKYYYYIDDWGTTMKMPKIGGLYYDIHAYPLEDADEEDEAAYQWPSIPKVNPEAVEQARKIRENGYPVVYFEAIGNGFLQNAPKIYGYPDWMMMLSSEEDRARRYLDKFLDLKIRFYDAIFEAYGDLIDVICENDDLGTQNSTWISKEMFQRMIKPYWKILFDHIKSKSNAKIFLHCCGSVSSLIPDLIDMGLDILNPVQIGAANMEPNYLKREFGKDIVFWGGGVDNQKVLPKGTPDEVREQVKRNIEAFRKDGGFVFATIHNVQPDVPVENFMAMWETYMENRNY
jgi:uroporphyrinogen decarboxylase